MVTPADILIAAAAELDAIDARAAQRVQSNAVALGELVAYGTGIHAPDDLLDRVREDLAEDLAGPPKAETPETPPEPPTEPTSPGDTPADQSSSSSSSPTS